MYPYLPKKRVKAVVIDKRANADMIKKLIKMNIEPIFTPECKNVYSAIKYHPDIMMHFLDNNNAVVEPETDNAFIKKLVEYGINVIKGSASLECNYPNDIAYNIARVGNAAFHNFKYSDDIIRKYFFDNKIKMINMKQGYAKCSICIVDEKSIITSDVGISMLAKQNNFDCLLIRPGYIKLWDLNYGFIGGCTGKISENEMLFCGKITDHPDYVNINKFLYKRDIEAIELVNSELIDLGSLIPIE